MFGFDKEIKKVGLATEIVRKPGLTNELQKMSPSGEGTYSFLLGTQNQIRYDFLNPIHEKSSRPFSHIQFFLLTMHFFYDKITYLFDPLHHLWEHEKMHKKISFGLVLFSS